MIERAIREYPLETNIEAGHISYGIDVGYSSSATGITLCQWRNDGLVYVIYSDEFVKTDYNVILQTANDLINRFQPSKIYVDAANPELRASLEIA